ncbi:small heat shock protein [Amylocystis lapponica]|nr:small heat shock protein [Amylocystis lapponica]
MSFSSFYYDPFVEFNRLLDDAFAQRALTPSSQTDLQRRTRDRALEPKTDAARRMDVHENPEKNVVEATFELPGLKKEDVSIDVHNNRLTVSGESRVADDREEAGYAVRERRYGKFSRTLQLPAGINAGEIKASMDNGVLSVTFPRASPESAPKKITVS